MEDRAISDKGFAALLFIAALLHGFLWAVITPPWQACDEPHHFGYVQHLWERSTLKPPGRKARLSREIVASGDLMKFPQSKRDGGSIYCATPEAKSEALEGLADLGLPDRTAPSNTRNMAGHYPPLYYWLGALGYGLFKDWDITGRLFGVRMVSVLLTAVTVLLMFFLARLFFPGDAISCRTASCLMLFQPMLASIGSSANCDALLFQVSILLILLCVRMIRDGITWRLHLAVPVCIAAGLLTKPTFAALVPLWPLALAVVLRREGLRSKGNRAHLIFLAAVLVAASLLYLYFGRVHIRFWLGALRRSGELEGQSFLSYMGIVFLDLLRPWSWMGKRLLTSYWANFGWRDLHFSFFGIYLAFLFITVLAWVGVLVRIRRDPAPWYGPEKGCWTFAVAGSVLFLVATVVMGYAMAHEEWGRINLQGRYLFPTLSLHLVVLAQGALVLLGPLLGKFRVAFLLVGSVLFLDMASMALVFERFYL